MKITQIEKLTPELIKQWEMFLENNEKSNIFQSPDFFKIYENSSNCHPILLFANDSNGNIIGVLLIFIQSFSSGIIAKFFKRSIIIGGPIAQNDNPNIINKLLEKYLNIIKGKLLYTQIRNFWDCKDNIKLYNKWGFQYKEHLNIIIDLKNKSVLNENISKNKRRNVIKSTNKGVNFAETNTISEIAISYQLIKNTYKKLSLPCPNFEYFINAYKVLNPKNKLKIFIAKFNGQIIATRIELLYNGLIYDWYAGSDENTNNKYPNDFLIYNILFWGHTNHFHTFDFGGAGTPNEKYGVRDHKLKFGGELVEFGRFELIHKPLLTNFVFKSLYMYKNISAFSKSKVSIMKIGNKNKTN